jgi:hypothetical protein
MSEAGMVIVTVPAKPLMVSFPGERSNVEKRLPSWSRICVAAV